MALIAQPHLMLRCAAAIVLCQNMIDRTINMLENVPNIEKQMVL